MKKKDDKTYLKSKNYVPCEGCGKLVFNKSNQCMECRNQSKNRSTRMAEPKWEVRGYLK